MSVVKAKTLPYGPAKIDIQIEQGADFLLPMEIKVNGAAVDLTDATIEAALSPQWSPGAVQIPLTIEADTLSLGRFLIRFPSAESLALALPFPPRKTKSPQVFELGGWILHITQDGDGGPFTVRYAEGQVYLDRTPWLT